MWCLALRPLFAALLLAAAFAGSAAAGERWFGDRWSGEPEYSLDHRPDIIFPGPNGGKPRISPFPMGKRAASVWKSDACWRDCTSQCSWAFVACMRDTGEEECRPLNDRCARDCQAHCRTRGGPYVPVGN